MSRLNNFLSSHKSSDFYDQVNTLQYQTLTSLATADGTLDHIACLKPICRSQNAVMEMRKAKLVNALINHLLDGGTLDDLGNPCNCEELIACDCS